LEQKVEIRKAISFVLSLLSEKLEKLRYKKGVLYMASYYFTSSMLRGKRDFRAEKTLQAKRGWRRLLLWL